MKKLLLLVPILILSACSRAPEPGTPAPQRIAPDSFTVTMTTTKGDVVIKAHRAWSPLAVDRFYNLIRANTYDSVRIFRVVPNFVAQWGLTGDSATDGMWRTMRVPDEPAVQSNTRGRISFARGGPESRTLQVFINLADNIRLDTMTTGGVKGYPPFGEVVQGMDVVDKWEKKYGEQPGRLQGQISRSGWKTVDEQFPDLDKILKARITKEWKRR